MHGVTHTLDEIRERGVPGFEVEVIGTDANVDRRLPAVAEVDIPLYAGLKIGVPSLPATSRRSPRGATTWSTLLPRPGRCRRADRPDHGRCRWWAPTTRSSAPTPGCAPATSGCGRGMDMALAALYGLCSIVLSPSESADASLRALGIAPELIGRWDRGVDIVALRPRPARPGPAPRRLNVLYAGRLSSEKGAALLADASWPRASAIRACTSCSPAAAPRRGLRERLGAHATFLGWLDGDALACAYASADLFLFASATDTFGQVVLEAQASGLPVVAVDAGGPRTLIEDGRTGSARPRAARRRGLRAGRLAGAAPPPRDGRARGARAHLGSLARAAGRGLREGASAGGRTGA